MRRDNLAELGITEEEFQEYASKKPRRSGDDGISELGVSSLAMGMDLDPSRGSKQRQSGSKPRASEQPLLPHCNNVCNPVILTDADSK